MLHFNFVENRGWGPFGGLLGPQPTVETPPIAVEREGGNYVEEGERKKALVGIFEPLTLKYRIFPQSNKKLTLLLNEMLAPIGRNMAFYSTGYYTEHNISITTMQVC